jgi:hypothetical protein
MHTICLLNSNVLLSQLLCLAEPTISGMVKQKQELSEYEQQRQANIAERDALLKKLSIDAQAAGLGTKARPGHSKSSLIKKKTPAKKIKEEAVPRRTSSRIAGLEADSEVAKRKADEEHEAVREAARIKRQRVSGDLNLNDIIVAGKELDQNVFADVLRRGAQPYERTFGEDEVKATSDKELKALREKMSSLELYEEWEPNGGLPNPTATLLLMHHRNQNNAGPDIFNRLPP